MIFLLKRYSLYYIELTQQHSGTKASQHWTWAHIWATTIKPLCHNYKTFVSNHNEWSVITALTLYICNKPSCILLSAQSKLISRAVKSKTFYLLLSSLALRTYLLSSFKLLNKHRWCISYFKAITGDKACIVLTFVYSVIHVCLVDFMYKPVKKHECT